MDFLEHFKFTNSITLAATAVILSGLAQAFNGSILYLIAMILAVGILVSLTIFTTAAIEGDVAVGVA